VLLILIKTTIGIINKDGCKTNWARSSYSFFVFFFKYIFVNRELFTGSNSLECLISDDKVPRVSPEIRIALRMDIATLLTFLKIVIGHSQLAS